MKKGIDFSFYSVILEHGQRYLRMPAIWVAVMMTGCPGRIEKGML